MYVRMYVSRGAPLGSLGTPGIPGETPLGSQGPPLGPQEYKNGIKPPPRRDKNLSLRKVFTGSQALVDINGFSFISQRKIGFYKILYKIGFFKSDFHKISKNCSEPASPRSKKSENKTAGIVLDSPSIDEVPGPPRPLKTSQKQ